MYQVNNTFLLDLYFKNGRDFQFIGISRSVLEIKLRGGRGTIERSQTKRNKLHTTILQAAHTGSNRSQHPLELSAARLLTRDSL